MGTEPKTTTPDRLDRLEEAARRALSGEEKLLDDILEKILHARIRNEYRLMKQQRGWGSSGEIYRDLAEKYYNNPDRERYIKLIIYDKY